jgi:hypothetical protein
MSTWQPSHVQISKRGSLFRVRGMIEILQSAPTEVALLSRHIVMEIGSFTCSTWNMAPCED